MDHSCTRYLHNELPGEQNHDNQEKHWNPEDILDPTNKDFRFAIMILNRPIALNRELMISLWNLATIRATVDGGTNHWHNFCRNDKFCIPDFICGDLDSIKEDVLDYYKNLGVPVVVTPDQNETDFTKAVREMLKFIKHRNIQVNALIAIVESSGRIDHQISNINTLYKMKSLLEPITLYLLSTDSLTWLLQVGTHVIHISDDLIAKKSWCSLIPFGHPALNCNTTGLKWNLNNQTLEFGKLISTSNTYSGSSEVTVRISSPLIWSMGLGKDYEGDR